MDQDDRNRIESAIRSAIDGVATDSYDAELRLAKLAVGNEGLPALAVDYLSDLTDSADPDLAIGAYIIAHTFNRRQGNKRDCDRLDERIRAIEGRPGRFPILNHFMSMTKVLGGNHDVRDALDLSKRAAELFPNHPGVLHSLAATYLRRSEFDDLSTDELDEAERAVSSAIRGENQKARFHYTRARIHKLQKKYDQALDSLSVAINLEDSSSNDYQLRLAEYKIEAAAVVIEKRLSERTASTERLVTELQEDLVGARASLEGAQSRQVETLAIFTAVLGIINVGATFALKLKWWQACILILVVGVVFIGSVYVAHTMIDARLRKRVKV